MTALLQSPATLKILNILGDARLIGGSVRDHIISSPIADIDIATVHPPDVAMALLSDAGVKTIPTGLSHGTITAVCDGSVYEVTTLRVDVETDGRHAKVVWTNDWEADASRRDFTFNALSMDSNGVIYDYFGGVADLRQGLVKFVGDPATRLREDYLRVLRFFRFYARYGLTEPSKEIREALAFAAPCLCNISPERIWSELGRILSENDPVSSVLLMRELGILVVIIPEGYDVYGLCRMVKSAAPHDMLLRVAALVTGDIVQFADRLRLSNKDRDRLLAIKADPIPSNNMSDADLRKMLFEDPADILIHRLWLAEIDDGELRERLLTLPRPVFPLYGKDVVEAGLSPGPAVGDVHRKVKEWWLGRGCVDDHAACVDHMRTLL